MKKIIFLSALSSLLLSSCVISRHSNMNFVKNAHIDSEAEVFSVSTSAFLSKPFIRKALLEDGDEDDVVIANLIKKVRGVRVLVIENQKDFTKINTRLDNYLKRKKYEEWMSIISDGDRVKINAKIKSNSIKRLLLTVNSEDGESVFVRVKGKFSIDDLSKTVETLTENGLKKKKDSKEEKKNNDEQSIDS